MHQKLLQRVIGGMGPNAPKVLEKCVRYNGLPCPCLRYGNPSLNTTEGKWVAIEFKKHQLRVGSPWASCVSDGGATTATASYTGVGTIIPVYLGPTGRIQNAQAHQKSMKSGRWPGPKCYLVAGQASRFHRFLMILSVLGI